MPKCERVKVLTVPAGMYVLAAGESQPPCRYSVRWCPKEGHVVQLAQDASSELAIRSIREHRVLGDTIDHLLDFELE